MKKYRSNYFFLALAWVFTILAVLIIWFESNYFAYFIFIFGFSGLILSLMAILSSVTRIFEQENSIRNIAVIILAIISTVTAVTVLSTYYLMFFVISG